MELDLVVDDMPQQMDAEDGGSQSVDAEDSTTKTSSSKRKRGSESLEEATEPGEKPPKTLKATKDTTLQGVRKQSKLNNRRCKVCGLWFRAEGMGAKAPYCLKDKSKVDQISRLARAQNREEWFSDLRNNEAKLAKAVQKYRELTGDTENSEGRKKAGPTGVFLVASPPHPGAFASPTKLNFVGLEYCLPQWGGAGHTISHHPPTDAHDAGPSPSHVPHQQHQWQGAVFEGVGRTGCIDGEGECGAFCLEPKPTPRSRAREWGVGFGAVVVISDAQGRCLSWTRRQLSGCSAQLNCVGSSTDVLLQLRVLCLGRSGQHRYGVLSGCVGPFADQLSYF